VRDVLGGVHERELVLARGARAQPNEIARVGEMIEEHLQPLRALRMSAAGHVREHAPIDHEGGALRHPATIAVDP
jgi:hypothetical protein